MSSFPDNESSESIFEKEDLIEGFNSHVLLHCHKQLFCDFLDQQWVLKSFTKYFETNK